MTETNHQEKEKFNFPKKLIEQMLSRQKGSQHMKHELNQIKGSSMASMDVDPPSLPSLAVASLPWTFSWICQQPLLDTSAPMFLTVLLYCICPPTLHPHQPFSYPLHLKLVQYLHCMLPNNYHVNIILALKLLISRSKLDKL